MQKKQLSIQSLNNVLQDSNQLSFTHNSDECNLNFLIFLDFIKTSYLFVLIANLEKNIKKQRVHLSSNLMNELLNVKIVQHLKFPLRRGEVSKFFLRNVVRLNFIALIFLAQFRSLDANLIDDVFRQRIGHEVLEEDFVEFVKNLEAIML